MIHTHHGSISRRNRDDNPFGGTLQVNPCLLSTSITHLVLAGSCSWQMENTFPVDDKFPFFSLSCAMELAMGRIILEHVDHAVEVNE